MITTTPAMPRVRLRPAPVPAPAPKSPVIGRERAIDAVNVAFSYMAETRPWARNFIEVAQYKIKRALEEL